MNYCYRYIISLPLCLTIAAKLCKMFYSVNRCLSFDVRLSICVNSYCLVAFLYIWNTALTYKIPIRALHRRNKIAAFIACVHKSWVKSTKKPAHCINTQRPVASFNKWFAHFEPEPLLLLHGAVSRPRGSYYPRCVLMDPVV